VLAVLDLVEQLRRDFREPPLARRFSGKSSPPGARQGKTRLAGAY